MIIHHVNLKEDPPQKNLRSSGRALRSRQLPCGTKVSAWLAFEHRHTSTLRRDVSIIADAEFCLANDALALGLVWNTWTDCGRKKAAHGLHLLSWLYQAVISAEISVHINCCTLTPNLCMSEMQSKRSYSDSTRWITALRAARAGLWFTGLILVLAYDSILISIGWPWHGPLIWSFPWEYRH